MAIVDRPITVKEVPFIPANLEPSEIHLLIPDGFDEEIEWELQHNTLIFRILRADIEGTEVKLEKTAWNPKDSGTRFPQFMFEVSSLRTNVRPDYFGSHKQYVLNQNQMLYMTLQHRLYSFSVNAKAFGYLLTNDFKAITDFMEYVVPTAYNAIRKVENTWAILSVWDRQLSSYDNPVMSMELIGDIMRQGAYKPSAKALPMICADLPIHPSSESSLSTSGKLVVHPYNPENPLYRSVGWKETGTGFMSIFPPKQNIVARLKTHLIADAIPIAHPYSSVFFQDNLPNHDTQRYELRDNCLRKAYIVFSHMNKENKRFLAGEIEASPSFVDTYIHQVVSETELFNEITLKVGEYQKVEGNKFVLGTRTDDSEVIIYDLTEIKCLSIQPVGLLGTQKVKVQVTRKAGNARIDSNTGLKGVTKCKPNLGKIVFEDFSYSAIKPDLVVGMNAVKAKENTIALAQAALAVDIGSYVPANKWGLLNTLDEDEINRAAKSLPEFIYYDEFGNPQTVYIGIVYARFTELGKTYGKLKDMSFAFETGRFLHQNDNKELSEHIWKHYVPESSKMLVDELTKILFDINGDSFPEEDLPTYSYKTISKYHKDASQKIFGQEDLVLSKVLNMPSQSKLLDPEWNKVGFYLDMRGSVPNGGRKLRVPSATILNLMVSELPDKTWCYPTLLTKISNILQYCLPDSEGNTKYHYISAPRGDTRYTETKAYLNEVHKLLYLSDTPE